MSYIDNGYKGHQMKVQAYGMLEECRSMQPGKIREQREQEAWELFEKGETLINEYRTAYEAIYRSK